MLSPVPVSKTISIRLVCDELSRIVTATCSFDRLTILSRPYCQRRRLLNTVLKIFFVCFLFPCCKAVVGFCLCSCLTRFGRRFFLCLIFLGQNMVFDVVFARRSSPVICFLRRYFVLTMSLFVHCIVCYSIRLRLRVVGRRPRLLRGGSFSS